MIFDVARTSSIKLPTDNQPTNQPNLACRFFDTTPLGRIVNRLSGDTNTVDERMPFTMDAFIFSLLYVLGGIVVNAVATPFFILPAVPMVAVFLAVQRFFIASSRWDLLCSIDTEALIPTVRIT